MSWETGDVNNGPAFGTTKKNTNNSNNSNSSSGSTNHNKVDDVIWDDVNGTGYGDGSSYVENTALGNYYGGSSGSSSSDYWDQLIASNEASLAAQKAAIQAGVDQNVNTLNAQKTTTSQDYADAYRQLYLNNMKSQKNIGQQMAALGVTGGASESTLLGLNTNYEDNLRQGKVAEQNALSELDQAIANAKLSGSIEEANAIASNAQNAASAYLTAWSQAQANEQAAAEQEQAQASENRQYYYDLATTMLSNGTMPSDDLLDAAGISKADAQTIVAKYVAAKNASGSNGNAYGVDNSGIYTYKNTGQAGASANAGTDGALDYWTVLNDVSTMTQNGTASKTIKQYINDQYSAGAINQTQANALLKKVG